ncbi:hypothetical protein [Streptomyces sp. TP-A0874]|uniref:hypothetical protein n=1 Tax=Streptomyces sp. TP-A0874 TaxID=549819 RepID=UPI000852B039|nr:hypothetical protein [Streptomyces sp. TP-A0874]
MDGYAGRVLAERYRLPRLPADAYDFVETRALDTYSGQEVLLRQVPLPEVVEAEVVDAEAVGAAARHRARPDGRSGRAGSVPADDPAVQRALEAARAAAALPDHPRLGQVFDAFVEGGSLWIAGELVGGRPLAALLAERRLTPYRAAEVAADVLTALREVHGHGWTHRNVTARTVWICPDGRAVLTGLAAGAAEEALCGGDPLPVLPHTGPEEGTAGPPRPVDEDADRVPRPTVEDGAAGAGADTVADPPEADDPGRGALPAPRSNPPAAQPGSPTPQPNSLAAERARQARILMVGAVTERWAPEQAGPIHQSWQLAPPVGPATDLWALGALLFRAVQGHAPYPEESAAEVVQLVCAEAPAFAEECGALRPVVESLLRQDPTERPEAEEVGGWLRSLVRSAPEPDLGRHTVTVPSLESAEPADPRRLPIVRRRGELVRRRRGGETVAVHGRHKKPKPRQRPRGGPRGLGRLLVGLILLGLVGAVAYAMLFMPEAGRSGRSGPSDPAGAASATTGPGPSGEETDGSGGDGKGGSGAPQTSQPVEVAEGFVLRKDPKGFQVVVPKGWRRKAENSRGQVRYGRGHFELVVVAGRDSVRGFGRDPMAYQQNTEPELAPFRDAQWSSASGLRRIDVGETAMAEGTFAWKEKGGRRVQARNLAMVRGGHYHVLLVLGPEDEAEEVERAFQQASATYRVD